MKMSSVFKMHVFVFLIVIMRFSFSSAESTIEELEKQFAMLHQDQDIYNINWRQLSNITEEGQKDLCSDIYWKLKANALLDGVNVEFLQDAGIVSSKVLDSAQVRYKDEILYMPLIKCEDERFAFYLADGDNDHVFVLKSNLDDTFSFAQGPYYITYKFKEDHSNEIPQEISTSTESSDITGELINNYKEDILSPEVLASFSEQ